MTIGRPKGGKNKNYSTEYKLKIAKMYLNDHLSAVEIEKTEKVPHCNVQRWAKAYLEEGIKGLDEHHERRGNPFAALHTSKVLTNEERLYLENLKLRIENERLKKGYRVKGVGANKEFVTLKEKSIKSSKH